MELFTSSLTMYIHQGFDADQPLEFKDIVVNLSSINNHAIEHVLQTNNTIADNIVQDSLYFGMSFRYFVECIDDYVCSYICSDVFDRYGFEQFVTDKLNAFFTSTDASTDLAFTVQNMTIIEDNDQLETAESTISTLSIVLMASICVILLCIIFIVRRCFRNYSSLSVSNALVVMIGIGDYSNGPKLSRAKKDVDDTLINLDVAKDIESLKNLCKYMNWTFHSKPQKVHWTEKEIVYFLQQEIGEMMFTANGAMNFDGLIVCISCHGIRDRIVTSDYRTIDETAIHRMVSVKYPKLREIPRIFLFDCCDGSDERRPSVVESDDQSKVIEMVVAESSKGTDLSDVQLLTGNVWTSSTKNPDYNLAVVKAANSGFAAKFNIECGSYVVYFLTLAIRRNVERREGKTLSEILEHVQNKLHDNGKQQTVNLTNNHTRTLVFKKNPAK